MDASQMIVVAASELGEAVTKRLHVVRRVRQIIEGENPTGARYWIAGGFVRDALAGVRAYNDVDIFFPDAENADKVANRLFEMGMKLYMSTANAGKYEWTEWPRKVDVVRLYDPSPAATIARFDFTVAAVAVFEDGSIVHHPAFWTDLAARAIQINDPQMPLSTLRRILKYQRKGFHACDGALIELTRRLQKIDLDNPAQNMIEYYPDGSARIATVD